MRVPALCLIVSACAAPPLIEGPPPAADAGDLVVIPAPEAGDAGLAPEPVDAGSEVPVPDAGRSDWRGFGAHVDGASVEFRVFSARATRLELELFDAPRGAAAVSTVVMTPEGAGAWYARIARPSGTLLYGYRAFGPNWPYDPAFTLGSSVGFRADVDAEGNRFNPNKLLFDPFALELSHDPSTPGSLNGEAYQTGAQHRAKDSGPIAPKALVLEPMGDVGQRPTRALKDDVIYEVHVRGLTMNDQSLPEPLRGTYAGAATRAHALADLGVTAVEFLPVQETQNDTNDLDPSSVDGDNYWGYSTLAYFAPDRRYSSDRSPGGPTREFQQMVRAFHDAGLKVFIDVVYNHTGERGLSSMKGLDNPTYQSLTADKQRAWDNTGVSGNVNTRNPATQTLIIESLRHWHEVLGVDGFRFDLAPVLGNACEHGCFRYEKTNPNTALNRIVRELPVRPLTGGPGVDLIAEPWAIGDGTYQMGNFPRGWAEWNDRFRDAVRSHQNQLGTVSLAELTRRLSGSADLFADDGRPPGASINFVVAHDGFTLKDLYSCNGKNNGLAWPWGPSGGGSDSNRSWDQGGQASAQRAAARVGLMMLLLSAGTPMMTGGDEQLRTLRCNNNPYNLDSEKNWLAAQRTPDEEQFRRFTQRVLAFRAAHPALRPGAFWRGADGNGNGVEQARWFQPNGSTADQAYLEQVNNHAVGLRVDGTELGERELIFLAINGWTGGVTFTLPSAGAGRSWHLAGDSCAANEGPDQFAPVGQERAITSGTFTVCARGVAVFVGR